MLDALTKSVLWLLRRLFAVYARLLSMRRVSPARACEVARYAGLKQFSASILDTYIPRCRRLTQLHFGRIVSNPDAPQAFSEDVGFNMTFNLVEPNKGNALHTHPAVEIFIALDGAWEIAWGEAGAQVATLRPFDLVAVPADVRHSYKNIEQHTANNIMTILPGRASITWAPSVVAEARAHGACCTKDGVLLDFWSRQLLRKPGADGDGDTEETHSSSEQQDVEHEAAAREPVEEVSANLPISDEAMARNVRRFSNGTPLVVQTPHGHLRTRWATLERGQTFQARGGGELRAEGGADVLLVVCCG